MAEIRNRNTNNVTNTTIENIVTPETKIEQPNKYDSILQRLEELETQNKTLSKKLNEARGDISDDIKESKRKYWYTIDWKRLPEEMFKYRYSCLMDDRKEKVVIETETIWRPKNIRNSNTWKWVNEHNIKVLFNDNTFAEMDILDYINQKYLIEEFVADEDIKEKDGKKYYTFHSEKHWTFTIAENFIN